MIMAIILLGMMMKKKLNNFKKLIALQNEMGFKMLNNKSEKLRLTNQLLIY